MTVPNSRSPRPPYRHTDSPPLSDEPLTLSGLPVRVLRGGSGPFVVCLHGYSCTADMWRPNLPDESDNHLVELAMAGGAEVIVTKNVRDIRAGELKFPGLRILKPEQLLKE